MDKVDTLTRSRTMAAVRSRGNRSTEWRLRPFLVQAGIRGWNIQASGLPGKPDFVFWRQRLAVFVDGCFWHGCPKCCRMPQSNRKYWQEKISRNKIRDGQNINKLRTLGWKVLRLWEHELRGNPSSCIKKIRSEIERYKKFPSGGPAPN